MKKYFLFLFINFLCINSFSQISFEKGYIINNENKKINCFIKNIDWKNNPTEIQYKLNKQSSFKIGSIKNIKEFGIYSFSKYVRCNVNIDLNVQNINKLDTNKNSIFIKKELFLKVLIKGKASLFVYKKGNLKRYFYTLNESNIEPLIYKEYKTEYNKFAKNNQFRRQLWNSLKCHGFKMNRFETIDYKKSELLKLFIDYNNCNNEDSINFEEKPKQDLFNLTVRPGLNFSSLIIDKPSTSIFRNIDFGTKTSLRLGLEAEFILPFNKNKWAILVEPTYQTYKITRADDPNINIGTAQANYNSFELPISVRHYFFLDNNSKLFVNASFVIDFTSNSKIDINTNSNSGLLRTLDLSSNNNLAVGTGYKMNDKFSLELRYQLTRDVLTKNSIWSSEYNTFSIIFGYSFFKKTDSLF